MKFVIASLNISEIRKHTILIVCLHLVLNIQCLGIIHEEQFRSVHELYAINQHSCQLSALGSIPGHVVIRLEMSKTHGNDYLLELS